MARRPSKAGALLSLLLGLGAACAGAQIYSLRPLGRADAQTAQAGLDTGLLPDGAKHLQVVRGQSFRVQAADRTEVTLLPVQFVTAEPGLAPGMDRETDLCGIYLIDAAGTARFAPLADNGTEGAVQCGGVEAVGMARGTGAHPQVLLLFRVHTVHRSWSDPYAVSWSDGDGRYVFEHLSAPAGVRPTETLTIARLRQWVNAGK